MSADWAREIWSKSEKDLFIIINHYRLVRGNSTSNLDVSKMESRLVLMVVVLTLWVIGNDELCS